MEIRRVMLFLTYFLQLERNENFFSQIYLVNVKVRNLRDILNVYVHKSLSAYAKIYRMYTEVINNKPILLKYNVIKEKKKIILKLWNNLLFCCNLILKVTKILQIKQV